ncbi:hypothetical protein J6590_093915 [Homalodisca vitripennis]|nr:hypothetical protein J6590_093915 [Homalodisca vitripennis]
MPIPVNIHPILPPALHQTVTIPKTRHGIETATPRLPPASLISTAILTLLRSGDKAQINTEGPRRFCTWRRYKWLLTRDILLWGGLTGGCC